MAPEPPTAAPVLGSLNETALSQERAGLAAVVQLPPPSVERRIVPPLPTATIVFASATATARRVFLITGGCEDHPGSGVTWPSALLAKSTRAITKETAINVFMLAPAVFSSQPVSL